MSCSTAYPATGDQVTISRCDINPDQIISPPLKSVGTPPAIDQQVEELIAYSSTQLRRRWQELTKLSPPRISEDLMRLAVAYEMQARALGHLSRDAARKLDAASLDKSFSSAVSPGTRLAREWNGTVHIVTIRDDGRIAWNGREWRSLSEVARAITGTRWSGPAFFGLKAKRAS